VPHSCLQRRLQCGLHKTLRSEERQVIFSKDKEQELVPSILTLSARGCCRYSDDIKKVAFNFAMSNGIKQHLSK
jgi:hypothetical protein